MEKQEILIVEDEGVIALQIESALQRMGHSVVGIYASGEKALESMETARPDLVLMDIKIQGRLDGIEVADRIRKQYNIPIIYITAHSEESTIERVKLTEPYGYLLKPVSQKELQIAVEMVLYKAKIDRERAELTLELQKALEKVKLLSGLLPICCHCKRVRDDKGYWNQIEAYIRDHSEVEFSHGLCDDCLDKYYQDIHMETE